jgi:ribosomal protein S18 acetylase RimI-like enzyme
MAEIREPRCDELDAMLELLPLLASFEVPARRNPDDLWRDDAALLRSVMDGERDDCAAMVAVDGDGSVLGVALIRMRPEPMSGAPSAHLEAIAVARDAEGRGIGAKLMAEAESEARRRGATCLTLHVFEANTRALQLYSRLGYTPEYKKCIKYLDAE